MREQIAMLDGLSGLGMSDPYVQDYSGYDSMRETTPVPGGGQNRTGGADWFDRAPYMLQQEGLAGLGALSMEPYGYAGSRTGPVPGNGQNYNGGSSWAPGFPTMPSSEGLASGALTMDEVPGYAGRVITPVPGNGQNYTGGADWAPGFPTAVSSRGLVGLGRLSEASKIHESAVRAWARCGVVNANRLLGGRLLPREIENYVSRMMVLGWPRRVVLNAKNISYLAALMTADYFVGTQRARAIARRAAQIGC